METGSDDRKVAPFRQTLHLAPDRVEEVASSEGSVFLEVSRSSVRVLRVHSLKAVEFTQFEFPFCRDDVRWAATVQSIQNDCVKQTPAAITVSDVPLSVIPTDLYPDDEKELEAILSLEHRIPRNCAKVYGKLVSWDARSVMLVPDALCNLWYNTTIVPFINSWEADLLRGPEGYCVHVHVSEQEIILAVMKGRELLLLNTFNVGTEEDVLYFVMATLEQMAILHSETRLVMYGEVDRNDDLHQLLDRYIVDIRFAESPDRLTYSYAFKEFPQHRAPFILNLPLCAL